MVIKLSFNLSKGVSSKKRTNVLKRFKWFQNQGIGLYFNLYLLKIERHMLTWHATANLIANA